MTKVPLADRFFEAWLAEVGLRGEVEEAIVRGLGLDPQMPEDWPFKDFAFDHYDSSFELLDCTPGWTPSIPSTVWDLGFGRAWLCYTDGTERQYWPGGSGEIGLSHRS